MVKQSMWSYTLTEPCRFEQVTMSAPAESHLAEGEILLRVLVGGICGSPTIGHDHVELAAI